MSKWWGDATAELGNQEANLPIQNTSLENAEQNLWSLLWYSVSEQKLR